MQDWMIFLKFADIGEFVNQPCKTYSSSVCASGVCGGDQIDPEILIVDDEARNGDVFSRGKML